MLVALLVLPWLWGRSVIVVAPGDVGVLWRRATGTDGDILLRAGRHLVWPWDRVYPYTLRPRMVHRTISAHCRDGGGVDVSLQVRFRLIEATVAELHRSIGPDYLEKLLLPELEAGVREVIGRLRRDAVTPGSLAEAEAKVRRQEASRRFVVIEELALGVAGERKRSPG